MKSNFYYFPPWRKQFIFSDNLVRKEDVALFYQPYFFLTKVLWKLWNASTLFRRLHSISYKELPYPFDHVVGKLGLQDALFQINTGTAGVEQKMTVLSYKNDGDHKFIKVGVTNEAKKLIGNEIKTLSFIAGRIEAPLVLHQNIDTEMSIMVTNTIVGRKLEKTEMTPKIFEHIRSIAKLDAISMNKGYLYCFAHGDCCPWNFIQKPSGDIVLIDWELSSRFPLGYDLFTYIFQSDFLLKQKKEVKETIKDNLYWIENYFSEYNVLNWQDYLKECARIKIENVSPLNKQWQSVINFLT